MKNKTLEFIIEQRRIELADLMLMLRCDPDYEIKFQIAVTELEELIRAKICYNHFFNQSETR